jgi:hypothetical protein
MMTKFDQLFVNDDYILYSFKEHPTAGTCSSNECVNARKFVCVAA